MIILNTCCNKYIRIINPQTCQTCMLHYELWHIRTYSSHTCKDSHGLLTCVTNTFVWKNKTQHSYVGLTVDESMNITLDWTGSWHNLVLPWLICDKIVNKVVGICTSSTDSWTGVIACNNEYRIPDYALTIPACVVSVKYRLYADACE